jgi:ADP-heptose:LPS heptosyltransferase
MKPPLLAICTTALGDTLMCTPALADLARAFTVEAVVHPRCRPVLEQSPRLARLHSYRSNPLARAWLGARLAGRRFARVAVLHANRDFLRLLPWLRYDQAAGLQGHQSRRLRLADVGRDPSAHFVEQRRRLTAWAGAPGSAGPLEIFLQPAEHDRALAWLRRAGLGRGPVVALCPGGAQPYKRWPAESFGRVAAELAAAGREVVVLGGPGEEGLAAGVRARASGAAAAVGLPLRLAAALLARCRLLVTNDTGPMHLAQAVGAPVLALFGPASKPHNVGPRGPADRVLAAPADCSPCLGKDCPDPVCMRSLTPERVADEAREMLAAGGPA